MSAGAMYITTLACTHIHQNMLHSWLGMCSDRHTLRCCYYPVTNVTSGAHCTRGAQQVSVLVCCCCCHQLSHGPPSGAETDP